MFSIIQEFNIFYQNGHEIFISLTVWIHYLFHTGIKLTVLVHSKVVAHTVDDYHGNCILKFKV